MEGSDGDSGVEFQDSREALHPGTLADSVTVLRLVPTTSMPNTAPSSTRLTNIHTSHHSESGESLQVLNSDISMGAISAADLIEDAKFYQDAVIGYLDAYETLCIQQEELQHQYIQQAQLVEEASEALRAAEAGSSLRHQEFVMQQQWEADIQHAVDKAVSQYQLQLSSAKSSLQQKDQEYQHSIQKLQDQVQSLELLLAGQVTLPSVGTSHSRLGLHEEVFNLLPGTVNSHGGAAQYDLRDQAFSFHKQVRFEDNNSSPKLRPEVGSGGGRSTQPAITNVPRLSNIPIIPNVPTYTSTPYCAAGMIPSDKTFDVSPVTPIASNPQDAATIVSEVSAAVAAQASKEFHRMHEPKITKLRGGYSADAKLIFHSWWSDILAHITDRELDNKVAIQLLKEQTLDNTRHEVEFQLDLCGGKITYQDLLKHLSVTFQGGDDEANILAEFYSHAQHSKESEEVFADKLQLLARKVISKKPDFCINLDTMLKQQYINQLYNCNSTSIAKTLLLQMPHVSFTQFRNELAQVLGTHQHSSKSVTSKSVSVSAIRAKSEEEEPISKFQCKWEKSSQIRDLRTKLDGGIAKNVQIRELLSPSTLQTMFTNALQATQFRQYRSGGKFLGKPCKPVIAAGKDRTTDPDNTCNYCKDMGHDIDNCLCLQRQKAFLSHQNQSGSGLN